MVGDALLVIVVGIAMPAIMLAGFFWYQRRKENKQARMRLLSKTREALQADMVEPKMGFPVEPGVQNWQAGSRRSR